MGRTAYSPLLLMILRDRLRLDGMGLMEPIGNRALLRIVKKRQMRTAVLDWRSVVGVHQKYRTSGVSG